MRKSKRSGRRLILLAAVAAGMGAALAQEPVEEQTDSSAEVLDTIPVDVPAAQPEPEPAAENTRSALGGEIVVTAQRREEAINDVPIAISAFSGEALQELGITDTRDLGNVIPGLSVSNAGFNKPVYTLRGIGFNETSQTASSTVGVYIDELNFPFDVMTKGANLDIERVEVLKGPQGTLYGRNTTGGAVNYVARKPDSVFEAGGTASYSRFQTTDVEGFVSGALTDTVNARFAVRDIRSQEGWQYSLTRPDDELGKIDKQSARLIVDWNASENLPIRFMLQGWRDHSEPQVPQAIGIDAQNPILGNLGLHPDVRNHPLVPRNTDDNRVADWPTEFPWELKDSFYMGSVRADWAIDDTRTLTLQGAYQDYLSDNSLLPQNGLSVINVENRLYAHTTAYNLEARLAGTWLEDGKWQLGLFHSSDHVREDLEFFTDTNSAVFIVPGPGVSPEAREAYEAFLTQLGLGALSGLPILPGDPLVTDAITVLADQVADTYAVFGNLDIPVTDTLKTTLGLRYTNEVRDYTGCSADSPERTKGIGFAPVIIAIQLAGPVLNPGSRIPTVFAKPGECFTVDPETNNAGAYSGKLDEDNVSGRAALDWKPDDDTLLYVSYSRGFKSGSFPAISASNSGQLEPVTQEQLDAIETGGKLTLFDRDVQLNYALFYYDYKDKQLLNRVVDPLFGPLPILKNAPKSEVLGAELELQVSPLSGLFLSASASYLKTEVKEFVGIDEAGDERDFAGNAFNFTPEFSYALLANYVFAVSQSLDMTVGADYNHKGSTNSVLGGDDFFEHDAYGVTNLRLGVGRNDGVWEVTAWGRNIFDEFYTVSVFDPGDAISRYTGMTRTYGLSLALRFD
ncbi:MAG: TonB-dependent receptor [Panacagrimonas sp.]